MEAILFLLAALGVCVAGGAAIGLIIRHTDGEFTIEATGE